MSKIRYSQIFFKNEHKPYLSMFFEALIPFEDCCALMCIDIDVSGPYITFHTYMKHDNGDSVKIRHYLPHEWVLSAFESDIQMQAHGFGPKK